MADYFEGFKAEYRLVDLDGIVLASPLDYIKINEPEDFDKIKIKLKRSKNHGIDFEFSDPETPYKFDQVVHDDEKALSNHSPYTFIQAMYDVAGVDAKCIFQVLHIGETPEIQYQGRLSMKFGINDDVNQMSARRINLDDLFRTRIDTPVNFAATTSIDGSAVTGLTPQSMFLHSRELYKSIGSKFGDLIDSGEYESGTLNGVNIDFAFFEYINDVVSSEFDIIFNYSNVNQKTKQDVIDDKTFRFSNTTDRNVFLDSIVFNQDIDYSLSASGFADVDGGTVKSYVIIADDNGLIINELLVNTETIPSGANNVNFSVVFNNTISDEILLKPNWSVYSFSLLNASTSDSGFTYSLSPVTILFECSIIEIEENSFADTYPVFESFNHILEVLNNGTNLLVSDFWQNIGDEIFITNGYKIRDFINRNVITSFQDMFDKWAMPVFGLGFAVVEVGGTSKVLMERYDFFYTDKEIITIDSIEEGSWNLLFDKDVHFNTANVGYNKFARSTDENKDGNIGDFNTKQELLLPLETIKKNIDILSDTISSGELIESQRREQFKEVPQETVSYDNDNFAIKGIDSDTYTGVNCSFLISFGVGTIYYIDIKGSYYNISVGDVLTFTNTASNNGSFTVTEIIDDMTGNVNFTIGIRLTVTEAVVNENLATNASMQFPSSFLRAERDEAFDILDGLSSPETTYNAGLNPKNMLMNQSLIINSGMNKKLGTAVIKTQEAFLNGSMRSQFKVGQGGYVLDPDRQIIIQNEDLTLSQINQNKKLHTGMKFTFKCRLDYSTDILKIRDACLNQSTEDINYGWIKVLGDDGVYHKGHILEMDYIPLSNWASFVCREFFE